MNVQSPQKLQNVRFFYLFVLTPGASIENLIQLNTLKMNTKWKCDVNFFRWLTPLSINVTMHLGVYAKCNLKQNSVTFRPTLKLNSVSLHVFTRFP